MSLNADQIRAATDMPTAEVPVPEWGEGATVRVRGLSAKQRFDWSLSSQKAAAGEPAPDPLSYLFCLGAINDDGARLFPQAQDADVVAELRGDVIDRVTTKIMELSGLSDVAATDAGKDSTKTPSGSSPTSSPQTSDTPTSI